jgi:predicted ABC-type ATPase
MRDDNKPLFVVFAGPNGSGKSTFKRDLERDTDFPERYINADDIKKNTGCTDLEAQAQAAQECEDALNNRVSFAFETVFSHPSKLKLMQRAKESGYWVRLYFMCLQDAEINVARVNIRINAGGHSVPEDKIRSRYDRSMQLLKQSFNMADEAVVSNNSLENPKIIAEKTSDGKIHVYPLHDKDSRSKWTKEEIKTLLGINQRLPINPQRNKGNGKSR